MVLAQTIGSVDMPGRGARKMPAPRQYVAIVVTWLVLQLIGGISAGAERATAAIGWVLVLTGLVLGPFGQRIVGLFKSVSSNYGVFSASSVGTTSTTVTPGSPLVSSSGQPVTLSGG